VCFLLLLNLLQTPVRSRFVFRKLPPSAPTTIGDYNAFRNPVNFGHTAEELEARRRCGAEKTLWAAK
jgi:hypothetical protein